MKKTNWLLLTLGIVLCSFGQVSAQLTEQHAIGGRFGSATGFAYRYTLSEDRAAEGILSVQSNSKSRRFRLVGLYEFHRPLAENFTWFYGFGGSVGSFRYKEVVTQTTNPDGSVTTRRTEPKSELALSLDGIIGVEYAIPTTPLSVSLDVKPYFDFLQESTIKLIDPLGLTIRYRF
ncbi:hypothetical protein BC792_13020 [Sphingobacterium allocomposti]|uniref:Outer membrane protein with beta-barrel domain n=1 Tax=Sphingobacterium allocomposti TaxID=415956 RepID=A0A5S5D241_9SPHI|nr:hypothetical protein [Sphingobacterium composti Yoo et al. 2007 non Ten et al. 2007]TYP88719.1 hypothetical protein BC792_13020 [Sphingobacterium composti Yoo et al. 2007 non Ten et al. 2007]